MNHKIGLTFPSFLHAIGHPTRQDILLVLRQCELSAGELAQKIKLSQPTISHHLSILKSAGVIQSSRRAGKNFYNICDRVIFAGCENLQKVFTRS